MKILNQYIQNMITSKNISARFTFKINDVNFSSYVVNRNCSFNTDFGAAQATFVLVNDQGIFGEGGQYKINLGDKVEYICYYGNDTTKFNSFYGFVSQRSIDEQGSTRTITLVCLDYIGMLQYADLDLIVEADKFEITDETLTPNYLPSPNDSLAQVFNFANDAIADNPLPILTVVNQNTDVDDPLYSGFEVEYADGQVKLGNPINAKFNYDLVARSYFHYAKGLYAEDIIQTILIQPDEYGNFLFDESNAQAVIDNHLTETFSNMKGTITDTLYPNYTSTEITLYAILTSDVSANDSVIHVNNTDGFPDSGEANINGDLFAWTSKTQTTLEGISQSGDNAIKKHVLGNYVEFTATYDAGSIWYLSFGNVITNLTSSDFSIPGANLTYFDKRYGRIILDTSIATSSTVTCTNDYSFSTMQPSGIEINKMIFRSKETASRLECINKVRQYLAPNFVIRTMGDEKIWASYLTQKYIPDYTLKLATSLNFLEDEDLYTRVVMYTKNKNPNNILLGGGATFVGTGESYKAIATNSELAIGNVDDNDEYYIYSSPISDVGKIILGTVIPQIYVNDVAIDNKSHLVAGQQVAIELTQETTSTTTSGK
jgi:hypothetical protein